MLMRIIIRKLQSSAVLPSQFINSIPKRNSFSSIKSLKSNQHVVLRTYVSSVPEINKSSELEQGDSDTDADHKDGFYYWQYFSTDPQFSELLFRKELIPENVYSSPLFIALKEFSSKTEIVKEDLECLLTHLQTGLQNLSFYELLEAANVTFSVYDRKDRSMWDPIRKCFDKEFLRRRNSLSFNEILMVHNVLATSRIYKRSDFVHKTIQKLTYKVDKLTHPQFIHFCYYFQRFKFFKLEKFKYEFLNFINNRIQSLNQMELGILSNAFTHTGLKFIPPLFQTVMEKVLKEMENMDAIVIKSICRNLATINYVSINHLQLFIDFQEKLIPLVSKFKHHQLHSLAYSGFSLRYLNKAFYKEVLKRVKSDMADFSLLDISRFVLLNANFNVDDEEFLDMAVNEFERRDDYLQNYVAYIKFLEELVHFHIYPKNLLEKVVSNEIFTRVMTTKRGIQYWASLKWNLEIEKPEFKFSNVNQKLNAELLKYMKYVILPNQSDFYNQSKLNRMLKDIYGVKSVCTKRILYPLPHSAIMRFNRNLEAQEIPTEYMEIKNSLGIKPLCDDHIWVCLLLPNKYCYTEYDHQIFNYKTETYLRQLSILGYKYIHITATEGHSYIFKDPSGPTFLESFISNKLHQLTEEVQQQQTESEN